MFTGLIEQVGRLIRYSERGGAGRVLIQASGWSDPPVLGESVAVEGVCLTVAAIDGERIECDVLRETLARTTLGGKKSGAPLNLERALRVGGRLGGHFVSGHVDGVGEVASIRAAGPDRVLTIDAPAPLLAEMVVKGSVAVNGVSLTIARLTDEAFDVHLIPHTRGATSLETVRPGDTVNIETDLVGKYVRRYTVHGRDGLSLERLGKAGFLDSSRP